MNITEQVEIKRNRITAIDAEMSKLREERRQCIVTAKKLEIALEHINEILSGEPKTAAEDLKEITENLQ